ncbi:hypothetical protein PIB30_037173 [Stylosanthes scabra]|uniref:Late embryogenesis abundant protein LEA-2 subgroup domain-containing protein n=1 Tax=Stylosanthes scabra TaxID=79078 RepID=A0ABU6UCB7_9FABA|nr:hypothetical protein [Stylosanthes scabra]
MERQQDFHESGDDANDDRAISTLVLPLPPAQWQRNQDTYIVQFPKDQVYHVPPPENALIAQRLRNPTKPKKKECDCSCWPCCSSRLFITIAITIISIAAVVSITLGTLYLIYKPVKPEFEVTHISAKGVRGVPGKNSAPQRPQYVITLRAHNPNKKLGLEYAKDADISLTSFDNTKVATGKSFPALKQVKGNSTEVNIHLAGTSGALFRELQKWSQDEVSLDLDMGVWLQMRSGRAKTAPFKSNIACKIIVSNLGNNTNILSQDCNTD